MVCLVFLLQLVVLLSSPLAVKHSSASPATSGSETSITVPNAHIDSASSDERLGSTVDEHLKDKLLVTDAATEKPSEVVIKEDSSILPSISKTPKIMNTSGELSTDVNIKEKLIKEKVREVNERIKKDQKNPSNELDSRPSDGTLVQKEGSHVEEAGKEIMIKEKTPQEPTKKQQVAKKLKQPIKDILVGKESMKKADKSTTDVSEKSVQVAPCRKVKETVIQEKVEKEHSETPKTVGETNDTNVNGSVAPKKETVTKTIIIEKDSDKDSEVVSENTTVAEESGGTKVLRETKIENVTALEPEKEIVIEKVEEKDPGKANETVLIIEKKNETSLEGKGNKITEKEVKIEPGKKTEEEIVIEKKNETSSEPETEKAVIKKTEKGQGKETEEEIHIDTKAATGLKPKEEQITEKKVTKEPGRETKEVTVIEKKDEANIEPERKKTTEKEEKTKAVGGKPKPVKKKTPKLSPVPEETEHPTNGTDDSDHEYDSDFLSRLCRHRCSRRRQFSCSAFALFSQCLLDKLQGDEGCSGTQ